MVVKNIRNFVVLFSIVAAAVAANAQATLHGKFQLANETRWGKAVLPAGDYSLTIDSTQQPVRIIIQAVHGKASAMALAETSVDAGPGGSYLFITGSGADRMVRSLNLPQLGRSLVYEPLTNSERETLYTKTSQTVPVQIARK
jgi:hypothetical protein